MVSCFYRVLGTILKDAASTSGYLESSCLATPIKLVYHGPLTSNRIATDRGDPGSPKNFRQGHLKYFWQFIILWMISSTFHGTPWIKMHLCDFRLY